VRYNQLYLKQLLLGLWNRPMHRPPHGKARRTHAKTHNGFHANVLIPPHMGRTIWIKGRKCPARTLHLRATPMRILLWGIDQKKGSRCLLRRVTRLALVQQLRRARQSVGRPQRQPGFNRRDRHKARLFASRILRSFHGCYGPPVRVVFNVGIAVK